MQRRRYELKTVLALVSELDECRGGRWMNGLHDLAGCLRGYIAGSVSTREAKM